MSESTRAKSSLAVDVNAKRVGQVYAKALVAAAETAGQTETVLDELASFVTDVLGANPKLDEVLSSALVTEEDKVALLDKALSGKTTETFLNFLKVAAAHGRLQYLRAVHVAAQEIYNELRGRVLVEVTSATELDAQATERLREALSRALGKEPQLENHVDPELIGGVVLRVGDTVYDGSVSTRLEQVRRQMIDRSVHEIQSRRDRFRTTAGD